MISAFRNIFNIPELRSRIMFTLAMLAIVRIGAAITLPGVDPTVVQGYLEQAGANPTNAVATLINAFSGGAITACAIFGLGIMPYISASIMVQLLTAVVPRLSKISRETGGRQRITQYTRYLTIFLCLVQGYLLAKGLTSPGSNPLLQGMDEYLQKGGYQLVPNPGVGFYLMAVTVMTAGCMFLVWLGEQITERGIGNGVSLIICVNILSDLPNALVGTFTTYIKPGEPLKAALFVGLLVLFFLSIASIVVLTQAVRKIAVNYAKRMVGRKVMGGQSTHLPIKLNYSGVMPIIFASAIISFPALILHWLFPTSDWATDFYHVMNQQGPLHWFIFCVLIFFFAYFWVATMFQPTQISEDLKSNGGYIPGIRPGKPTADFLDYTMSKLTFAGAIFLSLVAIVPQVMSYYWKVAPSTAQFFGGTSILIIVGVLLDVMRQVETHLIQQNYDGFLKRGRLKSRYDGDGTSREGQIAEASKMVWIYVVLGLLILIGVSVMVYKKSVG